MGNLFSLDEYEILTFGAVFVRYGAFFAFLPLFGHSGIPAIIRILFSLVCTVCVYPTLITRGLIDPKMAIHWSATTSGFISTIAAEALLGVAVSYVAKLSFDVISIAGNFMTNAMGFGIATTYDPHFEGQSVSMAELQVTLATMVFLACDGHHAILLAALRSYEFCALGGLSIQEVFSARLIQMTSEVLALGIQLSAPVMLAMFAVNLVFGIFSRAMPQLNVLMLSLSVSGFVGVFVLALINQDLQLASNQVLGKSSDWMIESMKLLGR